MTKRDAIIETILDFNLQFSPPTGPNDTLVIVRLMLTEQAAGNLADLIMDRLDAEPLAA